jgi:hypothetical protein
MSSAGLHQIVYVSSATKPFSGADLEDLLRKSRERNTRLGLTGLLIYADGNFLQVIEGAAASLAEIITSIRGDSRHLGIIEIMDHPIESREFPDWSMAFRRIETGADAPEGFNVLLQTYKHDPESLRSGLGGKLVTSFLKNLR